MSNADRKRAEARREAERIAQARVTGFAAAYARACGHADARADWKVEHAGSMKAYAADARVIMPLVVPGRGGATVRGSATPAMIDGKPVFYARNRNPGATPGIVERRGTTVRVGGSLKFQAKRD